MLQKVTFVGHLIIDTEGMSIADAKKLLRKTLEVGDKHQDYGLHAVRILNLSSMEEEDQDEVS